MNSDTLPKQLLNRGNKWLVSGKRDTREGYIGSLQTSRERTDVKAVGGRDPLLGNFLLPEAVRRLRLRNTVGSERRIRPDRSTIAVDERPVALVVLIKDGLAVMNWADIHSMRECRNTPRRHCVPLHHDGP